MNAVACKSVDIVNDKDDDFYRLALNYDLAYLLQLSMYNPKYAFFRAKELESLKRSFMCQEQLPYFYIDSYLSFNPIAIKAEIMERYLRKNITDQNKMIFNSIEEEIIENLSKENYDFFNIVNLKKLFNVKVLNDLCILMKNDKNVVYRNLLVYFVIVFFNSDKCRELVDHEHIVNKLLIKLCNTFEISESNTKRLLRECIMAKTQYISYNEFRKLHMNLSDKNCITKKYDWYLKQCVSDESLLQIVDSYINLDDNNEYVKFINDYKTITDQKALLDFYSDYKLFYDLANDL